MDQQHEKDERCRNQRCIVEDLKTLKAGEVLTLHKDKKTKKQCRGNHRVPHFQSFPFQDAFTGRRHHHKGQQHGFPVRVAARMHARMPDEIKRRDAEARRHENNDRSCEHPSPDRNLPIEEEKDHCHRAWDSDAQGGRAEIERFGVKGKRENSRQRLHRSEHALRADLGLKGLPHSIEKREEGRERNPCRQRGSHYLRKHPDQEAFQPGAEISRGTGFPSRRKEQIHYSQQGKKQQANIRNVIVEVKHQRRKNCRQHERQYAVLLFSLQDPLGLKVQKRHYNQRIKPHEIDHIAENPPAECERG